MKFCELLKQVRTKFDCANAKDLYQFLGGEKNLKIKLRQFQLIESGVQNPSPIVLSVILETIPKNEWHEWVCAYLSTIAAKTKMHTELSAYLKKHLTPAFENSKESTWTPERPFTVFSDDQLDFLTENFEAFLLFKKALLDDVLDIKESRASPELISKMIKLNLIRKKSNQIFPADERFRVPDPELSLPRTTAKANKYIFSHINNYLTLEGSTKQVFRYGQQYIPKEKAALVREQLVNVRNWIQSLAISRSANNLAVPFVFVLFGKELEQRELG